MDVKSPERTPKRILYVIPKTSMGGALRYTLELAHAAQKAGHAVFFAGGGDGGAFEELEQAGIHTRKIAAYQRDVHLGSEVRALFELYRYIRTERPQILHVNSSKGGLALLAGFLLRVPKRVFTVHGWAWNEERPFYQKILIWCVYYLTLLLATDVIVVSHQAHRSARFPFLGRRMRVIWNGIDACTLLTKDEARRRLLPEARGTFWVGVVAELHPIKGLPTIIEAYEHFVPDLPKSELVIIGEGQERAKLERQIALEGVSGTAHLCGYVENAASYLKAFDVLVLASRSENLPYALLEAGMAGVPVVATNVGGIPEIVTDGESGLLVPYGDRGALTHALSYLAQHPEERGAFASALHEHVRTFFTLERMVNETFALYNEH